MYERCWYLPRSNNYPKRYYVSGEKERTYISPEAYGKSLSQDGRVCPKFTLDEMDLDGIYQK